MVDGTTRTALVSAALLSLHTPVHAQERASAPPAAGDGAGAPAFSSETDIVVTAQRRAERLQDVPIAITALGGEALSSRGVTDVSDLRGSVPSLSISTFGGVNASNLLSIRGIAGQPLPIGAGQAVAIYLDGVYLARPDAGFFSLDDLERIEVLRGPQGTLYGRNATAGAVNIITRDPGQDLQGGFDVSYGNYNSVKARGSATGPLGGGFSAGLSAAYDRHDGWFVNTVDGTRLGGRRSSTIRGKLKYQTGDDRFDVTVAGDRSDVDSQPIVKSLLNGAGQLTGIGDATSVSTDIASKIGTRIKSRGASLVANYKVSPEFAITSISAYRNVSTYTAYDGDGSAAPIFLTVTDNSSKSISQELRGVFTGTRFRATVGGNYFREKGTFGLNIGGPALPPLLTAPYDTTTLNAYAVFGQFEFDITPTLTATTGLRYNRESRDFTVDYRGSRVPGVFISGTIKDSALLPSAGLNFKATPDILLYAKVSQGYQAPGFNFAPGSQASANTFTAEKLWAYELGAKMQFLDRRVTLNAAGFYYDYSNIQVRSVIAPGVTVVNNAATATAKGVEAELQVELWPGLRLGGQVTYLDAAYDKFCEQLSGASPIAGDPLCGPGVADRSGNRLNQAPKWTGGVNAQYEVPLSGRTSLSANVSYGFESGVFFTTANEAGASHDGWERLDARVALKVDEALDLYAFGRNLTNDRYVGQIYRLSPTVLIGSISDPRTYGVGLKYRFR